MYSSTAAAVRPEVPGYYLLYRKTALDSEFLQIDSAKLRKTDVIFSILQMNTFRWLLASSHTATCNHHAPPQKNIKCLL